MLQHRYWASPIIQAISILLIIVFVVSTAFIGLGYIEKLEKEALSTSKGKLSSVVDKHIHDVEKVLDESQRALNTMCDLVVLSHGRVGDFEGTAKYLLDENTTVSGLMLAPNGIVMQAYPPQPNAAAIGHDLLKDPERKIEVEEAIRLRKSIIAGPVNMRQGGVGLFIRKPIFINDKGEKDLWGLGVALINWETISKSFGLDSIEHAGLSYKLTRKLSTDAVPFLMSRSVANVVDVDSVSKDIIIPGGSWLLTISEDSKLHSDYGAARLALLFAELIFIAAAIFLYRTRSQLIKQSNYLANANQQLEADIVERQRVEDSLRQSEIRFRSLTSMLPVGIYLCNHDGACLYVNEKWMEMAGLASEQAMGQGWIKGIHADDRAKVMSSWNKLVESNGSWGEEFRFQSPNGKTTLVYGVASTIRDDDGNITGYVGANLDITERKQAELQLLEHYDRYHTLFTQAPVGIIRYDLHGIIIEANAKFSEIMRTPAENLLGFDPFKSITDNLMLKAIEDSLDGRLGKYEGDYTSVNSGRTTTIRAIFKSTKTQDGQLTGGFGIFEDTSERRHAEKIIRQKEHDLRAIVNNIPTLIGSWDKNLTNRFCNKAYQEWFGIDPLKIPGMHIKDVIGEEVFRTNLPYIAKALSGISQAFEVDVPFYGREQIRHSFVQYVPDVEGEEVRGFYAIVSDVTLFKQAQIEIERAKDAAEASSFAKSEFLANMSHEIRTPLNGICGMLHLLGMTTTDDEQSGYVNAAVNSSLRLTQLLSDILDISRIESGKLSLKEEPFFANELEQTLRDLFEVTAKERGIDIQFSLNERLPRTLVGDESRLVQILFNLVGNAIKFSNNSTVLVSICPLPYSKDSTLRVLFAITDKGIGISDDVLPIIFEPFSQGEPSATKRFQGAGLGLSIVRNIVTLMGGNITVESVEGEGTTFYVAIPFKLPPGERAPVFVKPSAVEVGLTPDSVSKKRILLVEDDGMNILVGKTLLEKYGFIVVTAKDGHEALEIYKNQDFDLIFMDIQMPIMNGLDATKVIRDSAVFGDKSRIPIIAFTAYAMDGDKEKILEAGMDDYISKPVNWKEVITKIELHTIAVAREQ